MQFLNPLKDNIMATNLCLSCDAVFDTLTRGPYPNGESNSDVDRHLATCHDCRRLAEALRPATELFHEAMATELAAGLPVYRAELPDLVMSSGPKSSDPGRTRFWMAVCIACLLVGCAAGFGLRDVSSSETSRAISVAIMGQRFSDNPVKLTPTFAVAKLTELPLAQECHAGVDMANHPTEEQLQSELDCCTLCHKSPQADGVHTNANWTTTIASSCLACHSLPTL